MEAIVFIVIMEEPFQRKGSFKNTGEAIPPALSLSKSGLQIDRLEKKRAKALLMTK